MDPSTLPLELFIGIFQYLSPLCTWRLRRTAKNWNKLLLSSIAVATALRDKDLDTFKRDHLSKPVSCIDLTKDDFYYERSFAFHGSHIAYMVRHGGYDLVLYIQNIGTGALCKHDLHIDAKPGRVYIGDVATFIAGNSLYIFTFDGHMAIRPLPGKYRGGLLDTFKNKVAVLRHSQESPESLITANTLWVYDHKQDNWTSQHVPETCIVSRWLQCLIIEDIVHIISVGPDVCQSEDASHDQPIYILHVRSGKRQWIYRYTLTQSHKPFTNSRRACMLHKAGFDYDVIVNTGLAHTGHSIRLTPNKFTSLGPAAMTRWHETIFNVVQGGIETPAGFLWNTSMPKRAQTPTLLMVNADYLVALFEEQRMHITHICVLNLKGPRNGLSPLFIWEDADDADRAGQVVRRAELVQRDPCLHSPPCPYTQEMLDAFAPGLVG